MSGPSTATSAPSPEVGDSCPGLSPCSRSPRPCVECWTTTPESYGSCKLSYAQLILHSWPPKLSSVRRPLPDWRAVHDEIPPRPIPHGAVGRRPTAYGGAARYICGVIWHVVGPRPGSARDRESCTAKTPRVVMLRIRPRPRAVSHLPLRQPALRPAALTPGPVQIGPAIERRAIERRAEVGPPVDACDRSDHSFERSVT